MSHAPARCRELLQDKVRPLLDGSDLARLLLYHRLQAGLGEGGQEHALHVTALTRLTEGGLSLDYSLLSQGGQELLQHLSQENVELVAELRLLLGAREEDLGVGPSAVYGSWAATAFLQHGRQKDNWIEAFSICQKHMDRMAPADFRVFVRSCILSVASLTSVPRPARGRIFKKAVKHCEVMMVKAPKDWADTEEWLQVVKRHSEKFRQPLSLAVVERLEERHKGVMDSFEMTGGEEVEVLGLVASLLLEAGEVEAVRGVLQVWWQQEDVGEAGLEVLAALTAQLTGQGPAITPQPMEALAALLKQVSLPVPGVRRLLAPAATQDSLPVTHRLAIVRILKELEPGEDEEPGELDSSLLAELYQTLADIQEVLPQASLAREELEGGGGQGGSWRGPAVRGRPWPCMDWPGTGGWRAGSPLLLPGRGDRYRLLAGYVGYQILLSSFKVVFFKESPTAGA